MKKNLREDIEQLGVELLNEVCKSKWGITAKHNKDDIPTWYKEYMETRIKADYPILTD